jgi:tRNA1(Val) A37 N6-methylase TrmN6
VVQLGSEHFEHPEPFNMVFTSPPYFDTERYFEEPGQCWRDYPKQAQWVKSYLQPTMETAKSVLQSRGALVLNVKQNAMEWRLALGAGVTVRPWPVKAGPFARSRGETHLNECLLVWRKP